MTSDEQSEVTSAKTASAVWDGLRTEGDVLKCEVFG